MAQSNYDSAESLNAFLECIGGAAVKDTPHPTLLPKTAIAAVHETPLAGDQKSQKAVVLDEAGNDGAGNDDTHVLLQLAQNSSLRLIDSKHSSKFEYSAQPTTPATRPSRPSGAQTVPLPFEDTPERRALINKLKENAEVKNFQDIMLARFKDNVKVTQNTGMKSKNPAEDPPVQQNIQAQVSPNGNPPSETEPFPAFEDISKVIESAAVMEPKDVDARIQLHPTDDQFESTLTASPTIAVTCATDSESEKNGEPENPSPEKPELDEDREHMTHFSTWGTPPSRDKPRSRVRKVVITGLPASTDFTLVQSLVSGGAIDAMTLSANGRTAYVTFASGEACDKFYDKYPNGITFKHGGKSHTVFVDKSSEVDVISGVLQGHLDCGATRCVRIAGIDEDWGMRALHRVAEGQRNRRKVENIMISLRNDIRTVVFRFTNIADAVICRAGLLRSLDFEDCTVEFTKDPCELAEGVHMD